MRKFIAKRGLNAFRARYGYDVSYMEHMLEMAPSAFFKFAATMKLAHHCDVAPANALFAAKLVGALAEDCGPCVQLVADMAREAGVPAQNIEAVLRSDRAGMDEDTATGFRFADALVKRAPDLDDARDAVRTWWGEAGIIDLTLGTQIGRIFPMTKAGLGFAKTCERVRIDDRTVDVVRTLEVAA